MDKDIDIYESSFNDYPKSASNNACKVLRWREEHGDEVKGMTRVGWTRANQLCKRENISRDTIARMASFKRHQKNAEISEEYKSTPWKDKGYVAWLGWGGTEGIEWAIRKLDQIDNKEFSIIYDIIINEDFTEEEKYDLIDEHFKKIRQDVSSTNVDKMVWDTETKELVVRFKDGSTYTYFDVSEKLFNDITDGKAATDTAGEWGPIGKSPSVGAAIHQYLIERNVRYKKGGSLR